VVGSSLSVMIRSNSSVFKTIEGYLVDDDTTSLVEKRRAISKGNAVIKKHGIRKLVKKRDGGGARLTIDDSMRVKLLKLKEVTIAKLEKKKEHNEEVTKLKELKRRGWQKARSFEWWI
jgi:hypothetical protein